MISGSLNAVMRGVDLASGAERILRRLDPVRLQPCLVFGLRLGQRRRLGQVGVLGRRCGHLDYARHSLGSRPMRWQVVPISEVDVVLEGRHDAAANRDLMIRYPMVPCDSVADEPVF